VAHPNYLSVSVDEHTVGHALDLEVLIACTLAVPSPVVFNIGPSFVSDVFNQFLFVLIDAQTNNPNVLPVS